MPSLKTPKIATTIAWLKKFGLILLIALLIVLAIFFIVTGKIKYLQKSLSWLKIQLKNVALKQLQDIKDLNDVTIKENEKILAELDAKQKKLELERETEKLKIEGLSNEEIASALRARGF